MYDKQETGKLGESLAAEFLEKQGFNILHRNYRHGRSEIDLIVSSARLLLFVEVKTRRGTNSFGYPEEAVNKKKAALILNAATHYIESLDWKGNIRFDIIAVHLPLLSNERHKIFHFEDAFY